MRAVREQFGELYRQALETLIAKGAVYPCFCTEAELQAEGKPAAAEKWLRDHDLVYDGVLEAPKGKAPPEDWEPVQLPLFRSTKFGDDQDRPIKKSNGAWTYFGADLAYHFQKAQSADALVEIADRLDNWSLRERAFSLGVNKYLGKPYQEDLLLSNIQELLHIRAK